MSPLELVDDRFEQLARELRAARPVPSERLRKRVAVLARVEPERGREPESRAHILWGRSTKRIALALAVVAIAVPLVGAGVQGLHDSLSSKPPSQVAGRNPSPGPESVQHGSQSAQVPRNGFTRDRPAIAPNPGRLQQYDAALRLRVGNVDALSKATKRAMRVTRGLGGYVASVGYSTRSGRRGGATLVVRVPVPNVQTAIERFSALGTILGQRVSILDVQRRAVRQSRQIRSLARDLARIERLLPTATDAERVGLLQEARADDSAAACRRRGRPSPEHARRRKCRPGAGAPDPALRARGGRSPPRDRWDRDRARPRAASPFRPAAPGSRLASDVSRGTAPARAPRRRRGRARPPPERPRAGPRRASRPRLRRTEARALASRSR